MFIGCGLSADYQKFWFIDFALCLVSIRAWRLVGRGVCYSSRWCRLDVDVIRRRRLLLLRRSVCVIAMLHRLLTTHRAPAISGGRRASALELRRTPVSVFCAAASRRRSVLTAVDDLPRRRRRHVGVRRQRHEQRLSTDRPTTDDVQTVTPAPAAAPIAMRDHHRGRGIPRPSRRPAAPPPSGSTGRRQYAE